ncbi:MAG: acyl-CoA thioesterase [Cohaesibacter sp.]|nr:acyl-CoA thioesterase [Cohaesibacter sp.]
MYPLVRLARILFKAYRSPALSMHDQGQISFYCRPWDIDPFMEMNNGRILTLYDLGRFELSTRAGLWQTLQKNSWGLAVAGSSTRYRKRIKLFDKVVMKTRVAGIEGRWFYIEQSMWVKGQPCNSVLLRTCVTSKGKAMDSQEVLDAMDLSAEDMTLPDWVRGWVDGDALRPWPPMS